MAACNRKLKQLTCIFHETKSLEEGRDGTEAQGYQVSKIFAVSFSHSLWSNASGYCRVCHHACTLGSMKEKEQRPQRAEGNAS